MLFTCVREGVGPVSSEASCGRMNMMNGSLYGDESGGGGGGGTGGGGSGSNTSSTTPISSTTSPYNNNNNSIVKCESSALSNGSHNIIGNNNNGIGILGNGCGGGGPLHIPAKRLNSSLGPSPCTLPYAPNSHAHSNQASGIY